MDPRWKNDAQPHIDAKVGPGHHPASGQESLVTWDMLYAGCCLEHLGWEQKAVGTHEVPKSL